MLPKLGIRFSKNDFNVCTLRSKLSCYIFDVIWSFSDHYNLLAPYLETLWTLDGQNDRDAIHTFVAQPVYPEICLSTNDTIFLVAARKLRDLFATLDGLSLRKMLLKSIISKYSTIHVYHWGGLRTLSRSRKKTMWNTLASQLLKKEQLVTIIRTELMYN